MIKNRFANYFSLDKPCPDDEKEAILKNLDELECSRSDWDRSNLESWYKIGEAVGKNKGIILGAICYASGFAFGKIIMKIISKK